ncbi:conserve having a signal peptide [Cryptosporidium sp. chipmunk genotype I]|uniref:conserve having a signal peptide n=1 Tax=Cryptosporidium sp. chipmunk genotype I TaxID=1280935 RepID=UPI00351A8C45|nr:conserve having a signal peptide [Cryptosporidium sp. chipmunk genotype I]
MQSKVILKILLLTILIFGSLFSIIQLVLKKISSLGSIPGVISSRRLINELYNQEINEKNYQDWQELKLLIPNYPQIGQGGKNSDINEFKVYIYSAYYDWRIDKVRINTLIPLNFDDRIEMECAIIKEENVYTGTINKVIHKEHHYKEYISSTLLCEIAEDEIKFKEISGRILLAIFEKGNSINKSEILITLKSIPKNSLNNYELSICVRPWWGEPIRNESFGNKQFNNAGLILEFINSYLYLGVNKFYLYQNYLDLDEEVRNIINYYSKVKNILEVIPYTLPIIPFKQVWDFAQTTMIQDCLLRNIGKTKYLLFVDTDEFVFPSLKNYNIMDFLNLLESSNSYYNNKVGAMWIPMYFHFLEWESDENNLKKYLTIEKKINKKMKNLEFILYRKTCRMLSSGTKKSDKTRRKVIVKPERVLYMGIHETEEMLSKKFHFIKVPIVNVDGKNELSIYLHHYRKAKGIVNNDPKQRELVNMYLENACSNKLLDTGGNSIGDGVIIDDIVWEIFGTHLYQIIFEHVKEIQNIYTNKETVKINKNNSTEKLHN